MSGYNIGSKNPMYGRKHSKETLQKMRAVKLGENNGMWKGDNAGYTQTHEWAKKNVPKPEDCQLCRQIKRLEMSNISGDYLRDSNDWEWLCRRCHMIKDGRMEDIKRHGVRGY